MIAVASQGRRRAVFKDVNNRQCNGNINNKQCNGISARYCPRWAAAVPRLRSRAGPRPVGQDQHHLRTESGFHAGHGIAGYGRKVNTDIRHLGYFPVVPATRTLGRGNGEKVADGLYRLTRHLQPVHPWAGRWEFDIDGGIGEWDGDGRRRSGRGPRATDPG